MSCLSKEIVKYFGGKGMCHAALCAEYCSVGTECGGCSALEGGAAGTAHSALLEEKASKSNLAVCSEASAYPSSPAEPND